jgi:hypothetical protein
LNILLFALPVLSTYLIGGGVVFTVLDLHSSCP